MIAPKIALKYLFGIVSVFLLYSCDCIQDASGTVLDSSTKLPIDSAYVQNAIKNYDNAYTNDSGGFEIRSISGGPFGCPPMTVSIAKKGYEIKTVEIESNKHETIYLEQIK